MLCSWPASSQVRPQRARRRESQPITNLDGRIRLRDQLLTRLSELCQALEDRTSLRALYLAPLLSSAAAESTSSRVSSNHKPEWPISTARTSTDQAWDVFSKFAGPQQHACFVASTLTLKGADCAPPRDLTNHNLDGRFRLVDQLPIKLSEVYQILEDRSSLRAL